MNIRITMMRVADGDLEQGDFIGMTFVPGGETLVADIISDVNSMLAVMDVPIEDPGDPEIVQRQKMIQKREILLQPLYELPFPPNDPPTQLAERRFKIDWAALNPGLRNRLEGTSPGRNHGDVVTWNNATEYQCIDKHDSSTPTLGDILLTYPPPPDGS